MENLPSVIHHLWDLQEPKEIESVDDKATSIELKDEEAYLKDIQMTTAVNLVAAHQASNLIRSNFFKCFWQQSMLEFVFFMMFI